MLLRIFYIIFLLFYPIVSNAQWVKFEDTDVSIRYYDDSNYVRWEDDKYPMSIWILSNFKKLSDVHSQVTKVEINCKSKTMGDRAFFNYDGFNANGKQISEHQIKQYELITKPDMSPPPFSNQGRLLEGICQTFKFNKE
jgi:hypothetical protein